MRPPFPSSTLTSMRGYCTSIYNDTQFCVIENLGSRQTIGDRWCNRLFKVEICKEGRQFYTLYLIPEFILDADLEPEIQWLLISVNTTSGWMSVVFLVHVQHVNFFLCKSLNVTKIWKKMSIFVVGDNEAYCCCCSLSWVYKFFLTFRNIWDILINSGDWIAED